MVLGAKPVMVLVPMTTPLSPVVAPKLLTTSLSLLPVTVLIVSNAVIPERTPVFVPALELTLIVSLLPALWTVVGLSIERTLTVSFTPEVEVSWMLIVLLVLAKVPESEFESCPDHPAVTALVPRWIVSPVAANVYVPLATDTVSVMVELPAANCKFPLPSSSRPVPEGVTRSSSGSRRRRARFFCLRVWMGRRRVRLTPSHRLIEFSQ